MSECLRYAAWAGLPNPSGFEPILRRCLEPDEALYHSDSFALLVGFWELAGTAFYGIFPAIHHHGGYRESLTRHLRHLSSDCVNARRMSAGNVLVPRHVAHLARLVVDGGAELRDAHAWDEAFKGYRTTMARNRAVKPSWSARDPTRMRGHEIEREELWDLVEDGLDLWEHNGCGSREWLKTWLWGVEAPAQVDAEHAAPRTGD